jgi:hypothetical protein
MRNVTSRSLRILLPPVAICAAAFLIGMHWRGLIHFLGIDTQASDNYDFTSGIGPMLLTAAGMSTLISGLWHAHNCHEPSCWRIGRHKIDGTPWCNLHHEHARPCEAVTMDEIAARLDRIITLLEEQRGQP